MKKVKFYKCNECERVKCVVQGKDGEELECCGKKMEELIPNTVEAATEKHIPVYEIDGKVIKVKVGDVLHPMTKEHHIKWIACVGEKNVDFRKLELSEKPKAEFQKENEFEIYAYCNQHGLWKTN